MIAGMKSGSVPIAYGGSGILGASVTESDLRGSDSDSPGFPLKACGNDELGIGDPFDAAILGMRASRFKLAGRKLFCYIPL